MLVIMGPHAKTRLERERRRPRGAHSTCQTPCACVYRFKLSQVAQHSPGRAPCWRLLGMARSSAFYAAKRRAGSSSNAATFSADTVELTLIAHSIVAVCSLLVTSVTNSLLAGCASLLLGMLYQSRPARRPSAAAQRNAEEEDASVPRWDRRSLGGLSEGEQAELGPEERAERGAGSVSPDEPFTLVRAGPARTSTAGAPPLPCA